LLLALLDGLGRLVLAGFARCRVVDLAKVVGLDRKRLVLQAVSRVRLGLDLAFNNYQLPSLEGGGGLRQRPPNLNLEPIGILVLGAATVFPCARRSSPSGGPNQVWREAAEPTGWEDGRKRRLPGRGLRRDALRHSLRHRAAIPLVEIAAGVAPRDMAALIRGESMLLKLTISFVPPSRVGLRQNKASAIRTDRRRRITFFLHALVAQKQFAVCIEGAAKNDSCLAQVGMHGASVSPHRLGNGIRVENRPSAPFALPFVRIARICVGVLLERLIRAERSNALESCAHMGS